MIESEQVLEWMAMGAVKSEVNTRIDSLLEVLAIRFPPGAPTDLKAAIRATANCEHLCNWLFEAAKADSLDAFRQASGL